MNRAIIAPPLPRNIRIDAATACQLKCPSCPTASGETGRRLGVGFLTLENFKRLVDEHRWISAIELSNWSEMFLNKALPEISRYAYEHHVALYASNGVNLNTASDEALEAAVRYKVRDGPLDYRKGDGASLCGQPPPRDAQKQVPGVDGVGWVWG